jgi:hypothetical protein
MVYSSPLVVVAVDVVPDSEDADELALLVVAVDAVDAVDDVLDDEHPANTEMIIQSTNNKLKTLVVFFMIFTPQYIIDSRFNIKFYSILSKTLY